MPRLERSASTTPRRCAGRSASWSIQFLNREQRVRLSVGAVNVHTGNSVYFDNRERKLGPDHIMASGALPPGFPPVMIDGEHYWDGGIVSNSPLWHVMDDSPSLNALVVQVDLFSARGELPANLDQVLERAKDIQYSTRPGPTPRGAAGEAAPGAERLMDKLRPSSRRPRLPAAERRSASARSPSRT
jgi:NTE family protein